MKKEKAKVDNKNTIEKENKTNETDETLEQKMAKKKVPKQVSQEILKKIFKNLILAIVVMIYFISCNSVYTQLEWEQMKLITKAISGVFLLASIISLEFAYKRDSGTLTMTAIELLVLAIHALFINHVVTIYQFDFRTYLVTSSYMFAIYYVLKSTVIYTRARMKYLKSLSDISEIVKDEPVIKEAKKRTEEPVADKKEKKEEKENKKQKTKSKKASSKNIKQENMQNNLNEEDIVKKTQTTKKKGKIKEEKEIEKKEIQEKEKTIKINNKEEKNEKQKVSKTKRKTKQNKEERQEETKNEQLNQVQEEKKSKKEEVIEEVKKQPKVKSNRGRKKKEEIKVEKK